MAADSGRLRKVYAPAHTGSGRDPSNTSYRVAKGGFWPVFGTATLPTGTPEPSSRGEGKEIGAVDGIKVGFRTGFGTAPMPTSTPEASWRGEGDIYRPFGTGTLNRTTSVAGSRGKTVWNRCQTGLLPMLRPDFGTASPARGLSVASWRGEAVIYWLFVHEMTLFHGR